MNITDICPFVRQALSVKLRNRTNTEYRMVKTNDCRLFYMTGGEGTITIDDITHKVCAGTCILIKAGTQYMLKPSEGSVITLFVVNFDYTQKAAHINRTFSPIPAELFCPEHITDAVMFSDCDELNAPLILHNAHILESRLRLVVTEKQLSGKHCNELLSSLMRSVILSVVRQIENGAEEIGTKQTLLVRQIIGYIQNHYTEHMTNADITQRFHYNAIYINRVFKKHTGSTVQQFLLDYRLQMSAEFLKSSDGPIAEIAAMTGFADLSYFSKLFKSAYGVSPSHYRMNP